MASLEQKPACPRCAKPIVQQGDPCPWCGGKGIYPFDRILRLGVFEEPLKGLIHHAKYHDRWPLAETLAARIAGPERARRLLADADAIIPIPLHYRRHFQRGYNQADVIARRLARSCRRRVAHPLMRTRNTPSQTEQHSHQAREENVRNAFALADESWVHGKNVVLIDDVMTTGATLQWAARALLQAKPNNISAIVLAVADPKGRDFQAI